MQLIWQTAKKKKRGSKAKKAFGGRALIKE